MAIRWPTVLTVLAGFSVSPVHAHDIAELHSTRFGHWVATHMSNVTTKEASCAPVLEMRESQTEFLGALLATASLKTMTFSGLPALDRLTLRVDQHTNVAFECHSGDCKLTGEDASALIGQLPAARTIAVDGHATLGPVSLIFPADGYTDAAAFCDAFLSEHALPGDKRP